MRDHPVVPRAIGPGQRLLRSALVVLAALATLTTLAACRGATETTPLPATRPAGARSEQVDVEAWLNGVLPRGPGPGAGAVGLTLFQEHGLEW
ncbi:hypothetical protein [Auraticoccus monumenti]|uniref:Uncharacterized protein n=1 Tax=Auraticoccus monumenti TaxID=675864 RepID=A0A1G6WNS8_9ACTN|nr:hypothetical protein [Auraticoccus monumenti]SDD67323.1 hypothetical protein SAMN04489747_1490 [Auraticoccus monumenti]